MARKEAASRSAQEKRNEEKMKTKAEGQKKAEIALFVSKTFELYDKYLARQLGDGSRTAAAKSYSVLVKFNLGEITDEESLIAYLNGSELERDILTNLRLLQNTEKIFLRRRSTMVEKNNTLVPRNR